MNTALQGTPTPASAGTDLVRPWQLERWLALARTPNVPLCLLLLPLVPGVSRPGTVLLAGLLALGDAAALALLLHIPSPGGCAPRGCSPPRSSGRGPSA